MGKKTPIQSEVYSPQRQMNTILNQHSFSVAGQALLWPVVPVPVFLQVHWLCVQHGVWEAHHPPLQAPDHQSGDGQPSTLLQQAAQWL